MIRKYKHEGPLGATRIKKVDDEYHVKFYKRHKDGSLKRKEDEDGTAAEDYFTDEMDDAVRTSHHMAHGKYMKEDQLQETDQIKKYRKAQDELHKDESKTAWEAAKGAGVKSGKLIQRLQSYATTRDNAMMSAMDSDPAAEAGAGVQKNSYDPLTETSPQKAKRYIIKATQDVKDRARQTMVGGTPEERRAFHKKKYDKIDKRFGGMDRAVEIMKKESTADAYAQWISSNAEKRGIYGGKLDERSVSESSPEKPAKQEPVQQKERFNHRAFVNSLRNINETKPISAPAGLGMKTVHPDSYVVIATGENGKETVHRTTTSKADAEKMAKEHGNARIIRGKDLK